MVSSSSARDLPYDPSQLQRMLDWLDKLERAAPQRAEGQDTKEQRRHERFPYRRHHIRMQVAQSSGPPLELGVLSRNISANGLGFLHGGFLHLGTQCTFFLPRLDSSELKVTGAVAAVRHLDGMIHEIGVKFTHEVNPSEFVLAQKESNRQPAPAEAAKSGIVQLSPKEVRTQLHMIALQLEEVINSPRFALALSRCRSLLELGRNLKRPEIIRGANRAIEILQASASVAASAPILDDLRKVCLKAEAEIAAGEPNT